jgi:hypothetical protein
MMAAIGTGILAGAPLSHASSTALGGTWHALTVQNFFSRLH